MSTSSAMRFGTILALLTLAVSFVTSEALLRNPAFAGRHLLQDDASFDKDAIAQDAESAKYRAAVAVDAHEKKLAAARNGMGSGVFSIFRGIASNAAVLVRNALVKAAASKATNLADEALDLLQKAPEAEKLVVTAQENLAKAEAKAASAMGIARFFAQAAVAFARGVANAAKNASDGMVPNARQKASDALAAAAQAETLANN